ncbi:MAG TPA: hypothetical protein VJZ69_02540 [Clostridia bacterium]|nr:hypothetical protein [Clostridia bacterium]
MEGLEIFDYNGEGYDRTLKFGTWCVAYLNYADRFSKKGMKFIERHNKTDEVFILLKGKATLLIGESMEKVPMEKFKGYNVKQSAYHNILVSKNAKVLIVENNDTSDENSEYIYLKNN